MNWRRFWIRKDRETYFLGGVIIACSVGSFVSSYWHFADRISVRRDIKVRTGILRPAERRELNDTEFIPSSMHVGTTQYYHLDSDTNPLVPKPPMPQPGGR